MYREQGFITVILMVDAVTSGNPDPVPAYVEGYGLTMPVLNDADLAGSQAIGGGVQTPFFTVLNRDMSIAYSGGSAPMVDTFEEALEEEWPEVEVPQNPDQIDIVGDDDDDDGGSLTPVDNPFAVDPVTTWEASNACSVGGTSTPPYALLALLPLLALRRRR